MNLNRSITPPSIIINIPPKYDEHLRDGELPRFSLTSFRDRVENAPPAPPPRTQEVIVCECKRAYLIVNKDTQLTREGHRRCGFCDNNN